MTDTAALLVQIGQAQSRRVLWDVTTAFYRDAGVKMMSYHAVSSDGSKMAIAAEGYPEEWVKTYTENSYAEIDPILELASKLARPFYWHEIRDLAQLSAENERYLTAMVEAKLSDGLAFYVFGPVLQNAYVELGFGKERLNFDPVRVFEFQCVAQAAHLRFCALCDGLPSNAILTRREHEILRWVARGKSNSVIADILSLSPHTVDAHIRSIYRKLGVADRTSAAIRGVGNGLLRVVG